MAVDKERLDGLRSFLDEQLQVRHVNKILHGFPSPRLWSQNSVPVGEILGGWREGAGANRVFHLYVGIPYCIPTNPGKCGYCLFPVEDIGGGTPNLLKKDQYPRLMTILSKVFPSITDADCITLEGIPPLFTRAKLATMKELGIGRISMGVQQINTELNALSGRAQTAEHTLDAIAWCKELGLACNADLIFGWPRQTVTSMVADLERLVATGVDHVTHYELNVGGATDFALNRREELPSSAVCREMYCVARDLLVAGGYRQLTAYDFEKIGTDDNGGYVYEECERDWNTHEMWGWGFAGVSNFEPEGGRTSWTYVNARSVKEYIGRVQHGEFPIERGFLRHAPDHRLDQLFRRVQGMTIDRPGYRVRFGLDLVEEHGAAWEALRERGLLEWSTERISLTPEGVYHTPLVQTVLALDRITALRDEAYDRSRTTGAERPRLHVLEGASGATG
jgi:oxygen-independent coproporphyrinogen-3 oxidase